MCVAAIIREPVPANYLRCMDEDNPHGGGVAWINAAGELEFRRGLDHEAIFHLQQSGVLTYPYLLHFRWATHGSRIAQLTHPFPTGHRAFDGELGGVADEVLIHNGVWNDYPNWEPFIEGVADELLLDTSDTAIAAYFYKWYPDIGDDIPWAVAAARVVHGEMLITKHGGWTEHEGNEYSNLSWLPWNLQSRAHIEESSRDWRDYVLSRYGSEVAEAVNELADNEDDAVTMAKLAALDEMETMMGRPWVTGEEWESREGGEDAPDTEPDCADLISDDPQTVNAWLAKSTASAFLSTDRAARTYTSYVKCSGCDIFTRAEDGLCGYCKAAMAKFDECLDKQVDPRGVA